MFSKYDVYTTLQSMSLLRIRDVLINKLNVSSKAELKQAEEEFTAVKQIALLELIRDVLPKLTYFGFTASFLRMCTRCRAHPQG